MIQPRFVDQSHLEPVTVSVITICRNAETHIAKTMLTVLRQSHTDLEYVLVDGSSTDGTLATVSTVAAQFPERLVKVISEPDQGISDAMNKGLAASSGDLVMHLHAGDQFTDDRVLERVVASYRIDRWRWAVAEALVVDESGAVSHRYRPAKECRTLLKKNSIPHQSTVLARDVFVRHGTFRADLKQAMDYEFWVRIGLIGGERYVVLPFTSTYSLLGGRSSRLPELLWALARVRFEFRSKGLPNSPTSDLAFLARITCFWFYAKVKAGLSNMRHTWARRQPRSY